LRSVLGQKLMPNPELLTQIINSCVLELTSIVTSHFLDGGLKLIVNSLYECLEGCKYITLINKKEHPYIYIYIVRSSTIINPYLFPPMLVYVVGPNKSMCNNSNALDMLIILFLGYVLPTYFAA
jgi:hypothetical protein